MKENETLICGKCQIGMESARSQFSYLGHVFYADVLRCPSCGQVFIPENLAKGRMAEVEMILEDK